MFGLIKKDIIVSILGEGKSNLKYFFIMLLLYTMLNFISYSLVPILITYLLIATTYYNDYENNNIKFIESLPVSKDDIVYSKYIMSAAALFIMILVSLLVSVFFSMILTRPMVLDDVYIAISTSFLIQSVVLPIYFKFGYHRVRSIAGTVGFLIYFITTSIMNLLANKIYLLSTYNQENSLEYQSFAYGFEGPFSKIFAFFNEKVDVRYINLETITIFSVLVFLLSMYFSKKLLNKDNKIQKYGN